MDEPTTALTSSSSARSSGDRGPKGDLGCPLYHARPVALIEFADRIGIMYAGELVETSPARSLNEQALHPYTHGLLRSFPPLTGPLERMVGIPGSPPNLANPPAGCRFHPRCPLCVPGDAALFARQTTERPQLREVAPGHRVACHLVNR